jgi:hypothetical protein
MIVLSLVFCIAGLIAFTKWNEVVPVQRAEKLVAENGPSDGATREEAEAWLIRQGIPSLCAPSLYHIRNFPAGECPKRFKELSPKASGGYIAGRIDASYWWGRMRQVWIYFIFDSEGRLIQRIVRVWEGYQ